MLLKLVQKHRGQLLILHRLGPALIVRDDQLRIYLSHFFSNQAVLRMILRGPVPFFVMEGHRPQPHQITTRVLWAFESGVIQTRPGQFVATMPVAAKPLNSMPACWISLLRFGRGEEHMDLSIIVAIFIVIALLGAYIWSRKKETHHLDDLHISPEAKKKQDQG